MKKDVLAPLAVLAAVLAFCLWNSATMSGHAVRWREQLRRAESAAREENWPDAIDALEESHWDWQSRQTYLHVVTGHGAVDEAEAMYRRCMAFAAVQEDSEFLAELAGLRERLRLLAEMERFSVRNIL